MISLILILKFITQCEVKHIIMLLIKTITSVLKVLKYIITSIIVSPLGLAALLEEMSVSTFITVVILYLSRDQREMNFLLLPSMCYCGILYWHPWHCLDKSSINILSLINLAQNVLLIASCISVFFCLWCEIALRNQFSQNRNQR